MILSEAGSRVQTELYFAVELSTRAWLDGINEKLDIVVRDLRLLCPSMSPLYPWPLPWATHSHSPLRPQALPPAGAREMLVEQVMNQGAMFPAQRDDCFSLGWAGPLAFVVL